MVSTSLATGFSPRRSSFVWVITLASLLLTPATSAAGVLTAGDVDDHLNWNHYLAYLARSAPDNERAQALVASVQDRVTLRLFDATGAPAALAAVQVAANGVTAKPLTAGSDGVVHLFPFLDGFDGADGIDVTVRTTSGATSTHPVDLTALRDDRTVRLDVAGTSRLPDAVDVMFVIDTTGSMTDELAYITAEVQGIVAAVTTDHPDADVRLGLTLYRDDGDQYVVRALGFTSNVATMQGWLSAQQADGGGDWPEAMDRGLAAGVEAKWRDGNVARLLFLVADAPPHAEKTQAFVDAAQRARHAGIHVYPIAASGVDGWTEFLMRGAAALTQARYVFLTDDSGVGNSHAEPSVPCYIVTKLDDLVARLVRTELTGERVEPDATAITRTVGTYEKGVCLDAGAPAQPDPPAAPTGDAEAFYADASAPGRASKSGGLGVGAPAPSATGGDAVAVPFVPAFLALLGVVAVALVRPRLRP